MKTKQEKDSRVYLHEGGLVIEYRRRAINFFNEYFQRDYRSEEFWIVRSGVTDWGKVRWFQTGNIWFDPAQGGIPIIDGPLFNNGVSTNDEGTGVSLFTSQGAASQHAAFQNRVFDATVSFEQLCNALRVIAGRKLNVNWAQVTDAQMAQVWGSAWNQREEWVFVSGIIGQEVYNPTEQRVQIDGSFKSLYVGPQF